MRIIGLKRFVAVGAVVTMLCGNLATQTLLVSRALGKDADPGVASPADADSNNGSAKGPATGARDPVATAFKLPSGVTLNAKQKAAYEALKAAKEDELRDAIENVKSAASGAPTAQAVKKVRECRDEIRQAIDDIVSGAALAPPGKSGPNSSGNEYPGYVPYSAGYGGANGYYPGGYYPGGYYRNGYPYYVRYRKPNAKKSSSGGASGGTANASNSTTKNSPPSRPAPKSSKR